MRRDIYQIYIGARGVAFTWLGAAFGPMFFLIGLEPGYRGHLAVGIASLVMVCVCLSHAARAYCSKSMSGVVAYGVVPALLLVAGIAFALAQGGV